MTEFMMQDSSLTFRDLRFSCLNGFIFFATRSLSIGKLEKTKELLVTSAYSNTFFFGLSLRSNYHKSCFLKPQILGANFLFLEWKEKSDFALTHSELNIFVLSSNFCLLFCIFHQTIALQKLWKMFFISSKKLFSFSRYSNFCIFILPCFSPCQPLL